MVSVPTLTFVTAALNIILNVPQSVTIKATREGTIVLGKQMTVTKIKNIALNVLQIIIEIKCRSPIARTIIVQMHKSLDHNV